MGRGSSVWNRIRFRERGEINGGGDSGLDHSIISAELGIVRPILCGGPVNPASDSTVFRYLAFLFESGSVVEYISPFSTAIVAQHR